MTLFNFKPHKAKISRTNIVLGIVLVFLIAIVIILSLLSLDSKTMPLANLEKKVDTIEITRLGETNILMWRDDKWVVANHNNQIAKQDYVIDIFDTLDRLLVNDIASINPDKQSVFQVDDTGTVVIMKSGEKVVEQFIVGKSGPAWPSSYLRWQDKDEVYLVRETLPQVFGWSEWRNMTIMQLSSDLISELTWDNGLQIIKQADEWQVTSPKELIIDTSKIKTVLDSLSNLQAIDIAGIKAEDLNQQDVYFILEILTNEGVSYKLTFWNHFTESSKDYDYYVAREGDDNIYIVSKYIAENIQKNIEFLED